MTTRSMLLVKTFDELEDDQLFNPVLIHLADRGFNLKNILFYIKTNGEIDSVGYINPEIHRISKAIEGLTCH